MSAHPRAGLSGMGLGEVLSSAVFAHVLSFSQYVCVCHHTAHRQFEPVFVSSFSLPWSLWTDMSMTLAHPKSCGVDDIGALLTFSIPVL